MEDGRNQRANVRVWIPLKQQNQNLQLSKEVVFHCFSDSTGGKVELPSDKIYMEKESPEAGESELLAAFFRSQFCCKVRGWQSLN